LVQYQRWLCEQSTSFVVWRISKKNATPQTAVLSSVSSFVAALPEEVDFNVPPLYIPFGIFSVSIVQPVAVVTNIYIIQSSNYILSHIPIVSMQLCPPALPSFSLHSTKEMRFISMSFHFLPWWWWSSDRFAKFFHERGK
jgi:hypothetical protein